MNLYKTGVKNNEEEKCPRYESCEFYDIEECAEIAYCSARWNESISEENIEEGEFEKEDKTKKDQQTNLR